MRLGINPCQQVPRAGRSPGSAPWRLYVILIPLSRLSQSHRLESLDQRPAVASETETLALHLVRALYDATDGLPHEWLLLEELDAATTDAIVYAITWGWEVVKAGHSICLTDAGRRLMESR